MTQTNNEREVIELNDIALKQQSEAWLAVFHVLNEVKPNWLDSNLPAMDCAVNAIKELAKSPISQNEQQVEIADYQWRDLHYTSLKKWTSMTKEAFDDINSEISKGLCWETRVLYASPPKQAIPEGWISVKDRLPDNQTTVICADFGNNPIERYIPADDEIFGAMYSKYLERFFRDYHSDTPCEVSVTHWMPLPINIAPTNTEMGE